ncbi:dGTP triphosphohydrolase [Tannerella forsythia]|uniref:DNTP triphosphohydrolase n=1 Tax=Tannerella forsythia TaxID=28112 RepID=A0A3P1XP32_TANFO|nr:dNTP triphosphohydrolase [Tannerella forsythia]RRD59657.1 dNTP triphosphohydrolase [Tannerella forsythia]
MQWNELISGKRLGIEAYHERKHERTNFQRDYDRLIFSSPFRRLQNKTQVFPLPGSIFVHNRLTHSLEVSCVGRSLGTNVATRLMQKYGDEAANLQEIGSIVSAACLAHDMGNPPFGHSGERAISAFFSEGAGRQLEARVRSEGGRWEDFVHFEGNANAIRLLTHQFIGRRKGGFALTYSTLASIVKYPYASTHASAKKKFGFFQTEEETYCRIAEELGIPKQSNASDAYVRYPLVYLVEAADDICYQIMDIEDAHKLRLLTSEEAIGLLLGFFEGKRLNDIQHTMAMVDDTNEQIAYLRSCIIGLLVDECTQVFIENEEGLLDGSFHAPLIDCINEQARQAYKACSEMAYRKIYVANEVVDVELAGYHIFGYLLETVIDAVLHPEHAYSQLLLSRVPGQYDIKAPTTYGKIQCALDYISGMTDVYALDLYRKITGMSLPAV